MVMIKKKRDRIEDVSSELFMFLTMFFPTSFPFFRLVIFLIWASLIYCRKKGNLKGKGTSIVLTLLFLNLIFLANGILGNAPGAIRSMTVDFIWPILFLIIAQGIKEEKNIRHIIKTMLISELLVCLFDILYLITQFIGITNIPIMDSLTEVLDCHFGNYGSFIKYTTTHMITHIFMLPFCIALLITAKYKTIISKKLLILDIVLIIVCAIASSRVAFQVSAILAVLIGVISFYFILGKKVRYTPKKLLSIFAGLLLILFAVIIVVKYTSIDLKGTLEYIKYKFETSKDREHAMNGVRAIQKEALLEGWLKRPIFGHGTGSYTAKCIRDEVQVWAYEYSYYAMLFQKGIVGTLAFFGLIGWIITKLFWAIRTKIYSIEFVFPFIVGLISVVIANYADPYLAKFGCMWMIYIPFAIANAASGKISGGKNIESRAVSNCFVDCLQPSKCSMYD